MAETSDNFSDSASSLELLEKAQTEFGKQRKVVLKNLAPATSIEGINMKKDKVIAQLEGATGESVKTYWPVYLLGWYITKHQAFHSPARSVLSPYPFQDVRALTSDFTVEDVVMNRVTNDAIVTVPNSADALAMVEKLTGGSILPSLYNSSTLMCVSNLSSDVTEWKFREFMSEQGAIEKCFLMRSQETGESKRYGLVEFNESLDKCNLIRIKLDWMSWEDRVLQCEYVAERNLDFNKLYSRCLLINNLPKDYKEVMELRTTFSEFVSPVYCQIVTKDLESLGFGLVEYNEAEDAEKIMKHLHGHKIKDTELDIVFCTPGRSAVFMFNKLMIKYRSTVVANKPSLLPNPVYPNPAFVKHPLVKAMAAVKDNILKDFKDYLITLQQGYIKQLERKTNSKPGLLGPAPKIPMSPLMDVALQLGLLAVVAMDMKEKKEITEQLPAPLDTLSITGPQAGGTSQSGKPSLLGDPMSAQANIVMTSILSAADALQNDTTIPSDPVSATLLLGKPVVYYNINLLSNLGHLVGAIAEQQHATGILGSSPQPPPRPLMDGLGPQQSKVGMEGGGGVRGEGHDGLLGNAPPNMKPNFMNTVKSLAFQKLSEAHGNQPQLMSALFGGKPGEGKGNRDGPKPPGSGLLGEAPPQMDGYNRGSGWKDEMGKDSWGYNQDGGDYGYRSNNFSGYSGSYSRDDSKNSQGGQGRYDDMYRGGGGYGGDRNGSGYGNQDYGGGPMMDKGPSGNSTGGNNENMGGDKKDMGPGTGGMGMTGSSGGYGSGNSGYDYGAYDNSRYNQDGSYGMYNQYGSGSYADQYSSSKYSQYKTSYGYGSDKDYSDQGMSKWSYGSGPDSYGTKRPQMGTDSAGSGYSSSNYGSGLSAGTGTGTGYSTGTGTGSGYSTGTGTSSGYSTGTGMGSGYSTGTGTGSGYSTGTGTGSGYSTGTGTGSGYSTGTGTGSGYSTGMGTGSGYSTGMGTGSGYSTGTGTGSGYSTGTGTGSGYSTGTGGAASSQKPPLPSDTSKAPDGKKNEYQTMAQQAAAYAAYTSYSNTYNNYMANFQGGGATGGYSGSYNSSNNSSSNNNNNNSNNNSSNMSSTYGSYGSSSTGSSGYGSSMGSGTVGQNSSSSNTTGNNSSNTSGNNSSNTSGNNSSNTSGNNSSMPPPPPGTTPVSLQGNYGTPQSMKRNSSHFFPSPEPSPEGDYIGQHSQGIGGHYAESYIKRQKLNERF